MSTDPLPTAIEREVRAIVELYRDRFNDNDADGLAEIYAPEISFVNLGGVTFVGRGATRDQQASGLRGSLGRMTVELEIEGASALGVDYVLALIRQTINDQNATHRSQFASSMTMILDHTSGSWLIRHRHNTPISGCNRLLPLVFRIPPSTPGAPSPLRQ